MKTVKRYDASVCGSGGDYWPEMAESRSGGYVEFSDYEQLLLKIKELEEEINNYKTVNGRGFRGVKG